MDQILFWIHRNWYVKNKALCNRKMMNPKKIRLVKEQMRFYSSKPGREDKKICKRFISRIIKQERQDIRTARRFNRTLEVAKRVRLCCQPDLWTAFPILKTNWPFKFAQNLPKILNLTETCFKIKNYWKLKSSMTSILTQKCLKLKMNLLIST